jgi:predicted enzyme related to lactoylglutathione lyase
MGNPFVWLDNRSENSDETVRFYSDLFGWNSQDGPGMKMLASGDGPFAGVFDAPSPVTGWIPYIEVDDFDGSEKKAAALGGQIVQERTKGPAGEYAIVRDPGGSHFALWKKA